MDEEEIISKVVSLIQQEEKMDMQQLSQILNVDTKELKGFISKSDQLVCIGQDDVQSRRWYHEKRSYWSKIMDNIKGKIE